MWKKSSARSCIIRNCADCEMYRDSNKREPHEFMYERVGSHWPFNRWSFARITDHWHRKNSRLMWKQRATRRQMLGYERREEGGRIIFSVAHTLCQRAHHHHRWASRFRRIRANVAKGARANLTHFRRTKSMPRAYFHVFFLLQSNQRSAVIQARFSLRFNSSFFCGRSFPPALYLTLFLSLLPLSTFLLPSRTRCFICPFPFLPVHLSFLATSSPVHLLSHTVTSPCTFRSLANNAAAALVPTRCFRWINLI